MESVFDKNLYEKKHLIVVNSSSAAETIKATLDYIESTDNTGVVYIDFAFDAHPFPKEYTEPSIRAINKEFYYKNSSCLTDVFCEFLKVDLNNFERITVWHGNRTSDLMFLYFFADYYGKPFYVVDIAKHVEQPEVVDLSDLSLKDLVRLLGKEILLTQKDVDYYRLNAYRLRVNDTGYHGLDKNGFIVNILPEEFTKAYMDVIDDHGGEVLLARMMNRLLSGEMRYCSLDLLEKILLYLLITETLKAYWSANNTAMYPEEYNYHIVKSSFPKEFNYQRVIIRSK